MARRRVTRTAEKAALLPAPPQVDAMERALARRRKQHQRPPADSLGAVLQPWYHQHVEKPGRQLSDVAELWMQLVPGRLLAHTRLVSLTRSVLCVAVPNATIRSELDMMLRQGLERQLQAQSKGGIHRVKSVTDAAACGA